MTDKSDKSEDKNVVHADKFKTDEENSEAGQLDKDQQSSVELAAPFQVNVTDYDYNMMVPGLPFGHQEMAPVGGMQGPI